MTDIHSHILYGLDDGAVDLRMSRMMLRSARAAGVTRIVATPHFRSESFDMALAVERFDEVSAYAKRQKIRMDLGFEVHWNRLSAMRPEDYASFCFQRTKYLLIEFSLSADDLPDGHDRMLYEIQRQGITIIIAHPERYRFVQRDISIANRWQDMGCLLQLDANCLLQSYEPKSKPTARKLFHNGLYDFRASDAHCPEDYALYAKALSWIEKHS